MEFGQLEMIKYVYVPTYLYIPDEVMSIHSILEIFGKFIEINTMLKIETIFFK